MASVCLYFHAHQPIRIRKFSVFEIGQNQPYFDDEKNQAYLERVVRKCYLPTNQILLDLIKKTGGRFKVSFSISGILLEQLEKNFPEALRGFQSLVSSGRVELLAESYHHSLAYLYSKDEFKKQVKLQRDKLEKLFGYHPQVFRNTELMFDNNIASFAQKMKYKGVLAEGVDHLLGWRSPNFLYRVKSAKKTGILLRNYRLSDDISFRFSTRDWAEWPLTTDKFAHWINQVNGNGEVVNLFMDYETFGEHQWAETGIFDFLKVFPHRILEHPDNDFKTPSEVIAHYASRDELDFAHLTTWADTERDLSAWTGNQMQQKALSSLYSLEKDVLASRDRKIIEDWRRLQVSDHFYYMCTKWFADGDVHKYFNPHESPYECFISFMNILNDLKLRLKKRSSKIKREKDDI